MKTLRPVRCALALVAGAILAAAPALAQPSGVSPLTPPENGPRVTDPGAHALVGGTVHLPSGPVTGGAVLIRGGKVERILRAAPTEKDLAGYRAWTLAEDSHVYPGFVDPWVEVSAPAHEASRAGRHWNTYITPDRDVLEGEGLDEGTAKALRELGFVAAAIAPDKGIMRGLSAVVSTAPRPESESADRPTVHARHAFHAFDFYSGGWGERMMYPTSQMGAVALIRQCLADAIWQEAGGYKPAPNALDALTNIQSPIFFNLDHELEAFQAEEVLRSFYPRDTVFVGSGTEIRRLAPIAELGHAVILPLRYPRKPDVSSVGKAESVELETMLLWEQAPTTARRLREAGATVALTTSKSRKRGEFLKNLHLAIREGLSKDDALAMVTSVPAELLGLSESLGAIEEGRSASLVVASGDLFDPDAEAKVLDVWIEGARHEIAEAEGEKLFDGTWLIWVGPEDAPFFEMTMKIDGKKIEATEAMDGDEPATGEARHVEISKNTISFVLDDEDDGSGSYIMSGVLSRGRITGSGIEPSSSAFAWSAKRLATEEDADADGKDDEKDKKKDEHEPAPEALPGYPFGPYAMAAPPAQETVLFTNATIWTSGPAGVLQNASLLIEGGKIVAVTEGSLAVRIPEGARTIDLGGRHITPGIIDAHSHTGTWSFGTNEGAQAITSEVRMEDTSDPDHINWYRQLAAGVTAVNTLHGSANPIGGQSITQKLRWGALTPRAMHMENATPGIKFALGENVVRSNSSGPRDRYPTSRMGVDTLIRDRFTAARQYARDWTSFFATVGDEPTDVFMDPALARSLAKAAAFEGAPPESIVRPRRDYELEPLAEILAGDRLIHCHSYRQDEILMLAKVAEEFGFTIGTYQHGLETYKVAEAVKANAIGASLFSDWWAYKVEVQDAIPDAGAILWETGVNVSFNSDSDELVRRMNTEAAKAVKYGSVPPAEALKFVTINPAIQLGIERQTGSIEVGKDADLAVWSGDPLSALSRCERTWVDGREYFSLEGDEAMRAAIAAERARLIARLNGKPDEKKKDDAEDGSEEDADEGEESGVTPPRLALSERILLENLRAHHRKLWLEGKSLDAVMQPGDCGCGLSHLGIIR